MKKCPYCSAELNDENLFCTECGKELPKGIVCPHCGISVNDGDCFCQNCGKRIGEIPSFIPSESSQKRCSHCGTPINDGDAFCMECGKATKEQKNAGDDNQIQLENDDIEHDFDISEESKTWWDYRLYIFGGLFLVLLFGAGWWYYDFSSQRAARERAIADSLEVARLDSIKKSVIKLEKEKNEAERKKREKEARLFCEQLSLDDLIGMVKHYDNPEYFQKKGLSLIYKDVTDQGEFESIEIVYGRDVEKTEKGQNGYSLNHTITHCCFFMVNIDTSTSMGLYFGNKDDANHFFERALKYGLMEHEGYYYVPRKKLPKGDPVHVDTLDFGGDKSPLYYVHKPEYERGFFCIYIGEPV